MTHHYLDLGSASDWSCRVGNVLQPIKITTQFWVVTRHQYGISALVSQTSFRGETVGGVANVICFLRLRTLITHKSSDNVVKWVIHRKNNRHPSFPPLLSKLGYWLFPTVLSSNTSTKLHGGVEEEKLHFSCLKSAKCQRPSRENCRN